MLRENRAQSTLEYVIILSAIVIALLGARHLIQNAINQSAVDATDSMEHATAQLPGLENSTAQ